jgi:endonuclease IV
MDRAYFLCSMYCVFKNCTDKPRASKVKVCLDTCDLHGAETNLVFRKILPKYIQYSYKGVNSSTKNFPHA